MWPDEQVNAKYVRNKELEARYLNKSFDIGEGVTISFDEQMYKRSVLIYSAAIEHCKDIFFNVIMKN